MVCLDPTSACREGTAKAAVPTKVIFSSDSPDQLRLFHPPEGVKTGESIYEEDPVEMVQLVLKGPRGEARALDPDLLAVPVAPLDHHRLVAGHLPDPVGIAEAALIADLDPAAPDQLGVDQGV